MTEKELKEKINKINDELNNINEKLKDSTDTAIIKGMYAKDELDDKIKEVLSGREQDIIRKRYGIGGFKIKTQREIAAEYGISRSYISRIEKSALLKLRKSYENDCL